MKKFYIFISLACFTILLNAQSPILYALTSSGGASGKGAIIKYDVLSNQLTADYHFSGTDGAAPQGSLVQAGNGLLYGMTRDGGVNNLGVIFSYDPCTNTYSKLYDFGGIDGARPHGALIQANNGILYGMTTFGGSIDRGVIFSYNIQLGQYTKLHNFSGPIDGRETANPDDGSLPYGSLMQAADGKLYGMTSNGGWNYFGVGFSFDITSSSLNKFIHFSFDGSPWASFIQTSDGFLYYSTTGLSPSQTGYIGSTKPMKQQFVTRTGTHGYASLLEASDKKLYGTTMRGGSPRGIPALGAVYSFDPLTREYKTSVFGDPILTEDRESVIFNDTDGINPKGSLIQAANGKLYGMTSRGGVNNLGAIYSVDISTFTRTKLQDFNGNNGAYPELGHFTELKIKCPPPVAPAITLTLVNAGNDQDIQTLKDGDVINLATLSSTNLNIRANVGSPTGSMVFNLSGAQTVNQTESVAPYALFGDSNGDYNNWTPAVGNYTLKATPFSGSGGTGTAGTATTINFQVVNIPANAIPVANAGADKVVTQPASSTTLNGSGTDANGTIASYAWTQVSGPNTATITPNAAAQSLTVSSLVEGTYIFSLVVTDNQGTASKADSVTVSVVTNNNITFTLVNSSNDVDIQTLKDGDIINLATLSSTNLNIRANVGSPAGSMVFNLRGAQTVDQTESVSPYALFGDSNGDYNDWTPAVGNYTLKATPFSGSSGTGTAGTATTINFMVVNNNNNNVTLTLVNSTTDVDIQTLKDGDVINLATLSSTNLNIRANVGSPAGSMAFNLSGAQTVNQTESVAPYALFGDSNGDYNNWTPAVGNYTLKATSFSGAGGTGTAGTTTIINFQVVNIPANGTRIASQNINAVRASNQLNVYPNPSITGHFTVSLPHEYKGELSYSLVSMFGKRVAGGKLVLKEPTSTVNFDFSNRLLNSGIYY